jgi:methionyl-tRNA formyltransferase
MKNIKVRFLTERLFGLKVKKWLGKQGVTFVDKGQDLTIICYSARILPQSEIDEAPTINFHPGYLPTFKGMHPQYWALINGGPYGVTIHWVTEKVDSGPIIGQKMYKIKPTFIGPDMDRITQKTIFQLFKECWPKIKNGTAPRIPQKGKSGHHFKKDINSINEFDHKIIRRLRVNTFKNKTYGYFIEDGKKYYIGIKFFKQHENSN